jgi:16S rRNA (adenine1518-N6/adenine1519-N6)-dimethyltransferase
MDVTPKKSLGQHFLTDLAAAQKIVAALDTSCCAGAEGEPVPVLEIGPGTGVLTQYLLQRKDIDLKAVELDPEAAEYIRSHFKAMKGRLIEADFLKIRIEDYFKGKFLIIGNFPYNISSQIFFRVLDWRDAVPEVVCMIQKEVAERIAEAPGTKTYGILSVFLQAWYDIEYLFTVPPGAFAPPPKVQSAVIRLKRNQRKDLGVDEALFRKIVKTSFGLRRKTLRNSLKPMALEKCGGDAGAASAFLSGKIFDLRPERLSVEDFISLTKLFGSIS